MLRSSNTQPYIDTCLPTLFWDSHLYVELRDLVCARLTLFNARLLLEELAEAFTEAWICKRNLELLSPVEKKIANKFNITYQSGKGQNHLVPIIIPEDTIKALKILADTKRRTDVGINSLNQYMFASSQDSLSHICGSLIISLLCDKAGVTNKITLTATGQRHRVSTLFASYDMPEKERQLFYSHIGHSKHMNEQVYQAPQALMEIAKIGKNLQKIDEGKKYLSYH